MSWVLFFDGECGFCSKSVRRLYALDKAGVIDFAPLQGETAGRLGLEKFAEKGGGSMVLLREEDGQRFFKGNAAMQLGEILGGGWALIAKLFGIFPQGVRDAAYNTVAKNRHLLAGKSNACGLPTEGLQSRMRK